MTFGQRIANQFALDSCRIESMTGGANLLWRLTTSTGVYVAKELPAVDAPAITRASEFETTIYGRGLVPIPEPIADRTGSYVVPMIGSRDLPVLVRVHRHVDAQPIPRPITATVAERAGQMLAAIQDAGSPAPAKAHWNSVDDSVLEQFSTDARTKRAAATAAAIVAESLRRPAIFSHHDFKPENCLIDRDQLLVLDWDESAGCNARAEAVSSAARWSWIDDAPDPELFAHFIRGHGRAHPPLCLEDWAIWLSDLGSWFEFMARQGNGEYAATAQDPRVTREWAAEALAGMVNAVERIPAWCAAINRRL